MIQNNFDVLIKCVGKRLFVNYKELIIGNRKLYKFVPSSHKLFISPVGEKKYHKSDKECLDYIVDQYLKKEKEISTVTNDYFNLTIGGNCNCIGVLASIYRILEELPVACNPDLVILDPPQKILKKKLTDSSGGKFDPLDFKISMFGDSVKKILKDTAILVIFCSYQQVSDFYKYFKKENFNYISQHVVNKLNKFAPGKAFGYNHELFLIVSKKANPQFTFKKQFSKEEIEKELVNRLIFAGYEEEEAKKVAKRKDLDKNKKKLKINLFKAIDIHLEIINMLNLHKK
jgi:hypothetical protein